MAVNLQGGGRLAARRAMNLALRHGGSRRATIGRAFHLSTYDKNQEEQVRPAIVPSDVIRLNSDKYWAPHPKTGVFGPALDVNGGGDRRRNVSIHGSDDKDDDDHRGAGAGGSILDQTIWFRSLEGVDRPPSY